MSLSLHWHGETLILPAARCWRGAVAAAACTCRRWPGCAVWADERAACSAAALRCAPLQSTSPVCFASPLSWLPGFHQYHRCCYCSKTNHCGLFYLQRPIGKLFITKCGERYGLDKILLVNYLDTNKQLKIKTRSIWLLLWNALSEAIMKLNLLCPLYMLTKVRTENK